MGDCLLPESMLPVIVAVVPPMVIVLLAVLVVMAPVMVLVPLESMLIVVTLLWCCPPLESMSNSEVILPLIVAEVVPAKETILSPAVTRRFPLMVPPCSKLMLLTDFIPVRAT